jgi:tellurite resistance protein TehA-like permease
MATGILSVGLRLTGYEALSRIALVLTSVAWLGLAADFAVRLVRDRERCVREARTPAGLTAVAATTVLGTGLSVQGWQVLAEALLALSAVLWPVLVLAVVRSWRRRMTGAVFLVCVATQGLSVLASAIGPAVGAAWLTHAALALFWLGIVLYGVSFAHFDLWEVKRGAGEHWVAGGALAISALAGAGLVAAHHVDPYLWNDDDQGVLRVTTGALLALDLAWYCLLLVAEAVWPRPRYDVLRWATVFPMGMTAVAALSVADALDVSWLKGPGQALLWLAVAAWAVVAAGTALAVRSAARGRGA